MSGTILNFGPLEILIIVVLVLLVFGPERLPGLMRQAGRTVRKMRDFYVRFAQDLRTELTPFEEEIRVLREVTDELRRDLAEIRDAADLRTAIQPITIDARVPTSSPAPSPSTNTVTAAAPSSLPQAEAAALPPTNGAQTSLSPFDGSELKPAYSAPQDVAPSQAISASAQPALSAASVTTLPSKAPPLTEDNPWVQLGRAPRADALDEDNPWMQV
ncbi:MAG: twin-arginine translocase TatA/TatE family subunit [Anaerolineae bacterium]|nr:twin-arginine translocase TatA/TatE family subunit [Thermoflexales bacterium]MDW8406532.1 twin-arginine translocase TatA/TatE family subunit [Anaerolineae bacterium]